MNQPKSDVLQGTLDLMVLKTLETLGSMHGYGIAQRLQQVSSNMLQLNQGTLYPALLRLEQRGWIRSRWGTSDNNRRAKFYSPDSRRDEQLAREAAEWQRVVDVMGRLLGEQGRMSVLRRVGRAAWRRSWLRGRRHDAARSERRAAVPPGDDGRGAA